MISEQIFPYRETIDQATAEQRESDKILVAEYLNERGLDFDGATQRHAENILRILGR